MRKIDNPVSSIGAFKIEATGQITGPQDYMAEQGLAWLGGLKRRLPVIVKEGYRQNRRAGRSEGNALTLAILIGIHSDFWAWRSRRALIGAR
jgi:hypothetical protein